MWNRIILGSNSFEPPDLPKSNSARPVAVGLLDTPSCRSRLPCSLGCQLLPAKEGKNYIGGPIELPRSLSSSRFSCSLLSTSHGREERVTIIQCNSTEYFLNTKLVVLTGKERYVITYKMRELMLGWVGLGEPDPQRPLQLPWESIISNLFSQWWASVVDVISSLYPKIVVIFIVALDISLQFALRNFIRCY